MRSGAKAIWQAALAALVSLFLFGGEALAGQIDCPLRNQAYSIDTPLIDILLKPEARTLVEEESPGVWRRIPQRWQGTGNQSFAAIVTLHSLSRMMHLSADDLARIDVGLRRLQLTYAD